MPANLRSALWYLLLAAVLALVPLSGGYVTGLAAEVLVFAIFAMSLDLLVGYTGLVSLGHAAFFGVGTLWLVAALIGVSAWLRRPRSTTIGTTSAMRRARGASNRRNASPAV